MKREPANTEVRVRPRPAEIVELTIPQDVVAVLKQLAERRDMSQQALMTFYINQGLRQDLAALANDHLLESAAEVLARHIGSAAEVTEIVAEIRRVNGEKWHPWTTARHTVAAAKDNGHGDEEG